MQIVLIVAFGVLLMLPGRSIFPPARTGAQGTLALALGFTLLVAAATAVGAWLCLVRLRQPGGFARAAAIFGRINIGIRLGLLAIFGLLIAQTGWIHLVRRTWGLGRWPLVDELAIVSPILIGAILCWLAMYPADRALRLAACASLPEHPAPRRAWTLAQYMDFQVRNQILTVLVPLALFVLAADLVHDNRRWLPAAVRTVAIPDVLVPLIPDALLAVIAGAIFVVAPVILRWVWRTQRLPASDLRSRLERICRRLDLRYRDILIWKSHGAMVNAAVMGLLPRIRYILLSDGLLEHLSDEQVQAVFGHEAGHVRERHILYYMVFAIGSMVGGHLVAQGLLAATDWSRETIELLAAGTIAALWIFVFGWISRRFERQADLAGVRSLGQELTACVLPCWQHNLAPSAPAGQALCSTAAHVFAAALEAVAVLNGISKQARSWRHSPIAARQEFVRQAAFSPDLPRRFERRIAWIKALLVIGTLLLACMGAWMYWPALRQAPPRPPLRRGLPILVRVDRPGAHRGREVDEFTSQHMETTDAWA